MSDAPKQRISLWLFVISFLAFGLMVQGGSDNVTSRIALSLAFAERGSLYIDEFAPGNGDIGTARGHYISDKAPGLSFLALPAVGITVNVLHLLKPDEYPASQKADLTRDFNIWVLWIATLMTSSLNTALAVIVLFRTVLLLGASIQGAVFAAIIYGFATPTWGWATTFFSHASCGAFLVFGFGAIVAATVPAHDKWSKLKCAAAGMGAGLLLGTAIVLELTAPPAVICIAIYGLWRSLRLTPDRMLSLLAGALTGGMIAAVPFLLYNAALFGSPLAIGYSHSLGYAGYGSEVLTNGSSVSFLTSAFAVPNPIVAAKLLFGGERGLLWLSPILALAPITWLAMDRAGERAIWLLCICVFLTFFLVNASYIDWQAGWSTGPRYITPSLPFLALPFAWLWDSSRPVGRLTLGGLLIVSGLLCFAMASINITAAPIAENGVKNPVIDTLLPGLAKQQLPNLVFEQLGGGPGAAIASYGLLIGGLILLWLYASSLETRLASSALTEKKV